MADDTAGLTVRPPGDERELLALEAHQVERKIVEGCAAIRTAWVYLAKYLYEFVEDRMWERLEHESLNAWLAQPEVELSRSHVLALTGAYRTLVVERDVPVDELKGLDLRKVQYALPAVRAGEVPWQVALSDARSSTREDMRREYERGRNKGLDGSEEPERTRCPTCGTWVETERVTGEAA